MADSQRIHDWLQDSNFEALSEPIIGDPYGLYPEPRPDPDILNESELNLILGAEGNESDRSSDEEDVHQRTAKTTKNVSFREDEGDTLPDTDGYKPQAFQYNGRMVLVALPGFLLTLTVAGDLLLTVVTIGGIVTYLLHTAEEYRKSVISFMICFACSQMTVLYSAFPLVWLSVFNIALLIYLNMFSVLTGGWGLLQFEKFRTDEKDLTKMIEPMLFTLYPAVNVVLVTWFVGSSISPQLAPYTLLLFGFAVLQLFLTPVPSSFCQADEKGNYQRFVLEPDMTGSVAILFSICPTILHFIIHLFGFGPLEFAFLIESVFLLCGSVFLSSLLNLRPFFNLHDIPFSNIYVTRWISGSAVLLLLSFVLKIYGFKLYLLPWLPIGIIIHAAYGFVASKKNAKFHGIVAAGGLGLLYGYMFYKLPWNLTHKVSDSLHLNMMQFLLVINATLCIVSTYASAHCSSGILGFCLLLQSLAYVSCESTLLSDMCYMPLVLLSTILAVYLLLKLYHVGKIPLQHSWMSTSVHMSKLFLTLRSHMTSSENTEGNLMHFLVTCILCLIVFYVAVFETDSAVSSQKFILVGMSVLAACAAGGHRCLGDVYQFLFRTPPSVIDFAGLSMITVSLVLLKLAIYHQCELQWSKHISVAFSVAALALMHLQPELSFDGVDQSKWLFVMSVVCAVVCVPLSVILNSKLQLVVFGYCIGVTFGAALSLRLFGDLAPGSTAVLYGFVFGQLGTICLLAWKAKSTLSLLSKMILMVSLACCILFLDDYVAPLDDVPIMPGCLAVLCCSLTVAVVLKLSPLHEKMEDADLTRSGDIRISHLAVIGNVSTVTAFIMVLQLCPVDTREIWCIGSSVILVLLQRDGYLLERLSSDNYYLPLILVTVFVLKLSTFQKSSFFIYTNTIHLLTGVLELSLLFITIPNYVILVSYLWFQRTVLSAKLVVFLTPLYVFLFIFGTSLVSWVTAVCGLCIGAWLIRYKLPLEV